MLLSITGLVRTLLIIIAVIVILRFFGQLMNAKRNRDAEKQLERQQSKEAEDRKNYERNKGKISISKSSKDDFAEDTDFEEIKE
jgi:uncharacterized membrane protein YhiD involved in acid resistance